MEIKSQPTMYFINSNAIGDTVASLPILKDIIDNFHQDGNYGVITLPQFRDLFFFVDDEHFFDINQPMINENYSFAKLNITESDKKIYFQLPNQLAMALDFKLQSLTPLRIHLSQYAGLQFANKIYSIEECNYLQYPIDTELDIQVQDKFKIDFSKCVLLNLTYRGDTRIIEPGVINDFCKYIKEKGLMPLFVGKKETPEYVNNAPYKTLEFDTSIGIDLRDKTTIKEMIYIMNQAHSIMGVDNGLIHLAAMTKLPIIAAYTSCSPETRCPVRYGKLGGGIEIVEADEACRYCSDKWNISGHDFNNCYYATNACCKSLTLGKFINAFENIR